MILERSHGIIVCSAKRSVVFANQYPDGIVDGSHVPDRFKTTRPKYRRTAWCYSKCFSTNKFIEQQYFNQESDSGGESKQMFSSAGISDNSNGILPLLMKSEIPMKNLLFYIRELAMKTWEQSKARFANHRTPVVNSRAKRLFPSNTRPLPAVWQLQIHDKFRNSSVVQPSVEQKPKRNGILEILGCILSNFNAIIKRANSIMLSHFFN